ncbi:DUF1524 domain-containing protein [Gordonia sp. VNK21]|uniref:GmrSD restriction endonuclease domain-containing protein n=1 Tax=Gordonia sp. VNK21 TaxID=3382483 RepID=UPI0038D42EE4
MTKAGRGTGALPVHYFDERTPVRVTSLFAALAVIVGLFSAPLAPAVVAAAPSARQQALTDLNTLAVKGRAPKTGYDRALFGQAWSDDVSVAGGHNGCDTRNDILRRDLTDITVKAGTRDCVVLSGTLADPYTGQTIRFVRGPESSAVQIDHVVALSDAWQKGAQGWSSDKRRDFANDPVNLLAVSGTANQSKGDGDAATWLPRNKAYRCTYVAKQVTVKKKYGVWVTAAEKDAIARILGDCNGDAPQQTRPAPAVPQQQPDEVYYRNCSAARAAGAAPLHRGQPGYRSGLDGDGDGIACE